MKQPLLQGIMNRILPGWSIDANYSPKAENGRIVVVWNSFLSVVTYMKTDQLMLCSVCNPTTRETFKVAFIYAKNRREERIPLWNLIKDLATSNTLKDSPFLVIGDFNQILSTSEAFSLHQSNLSLQGMDDLRECLSTSALFDLDFRGCSHTWSIKSPTNPKTRKFDRVLINEAWQDCFPLSSAFFDVTGSLDHSPCLLKISEPPYQRKNRFTFFSVFTTHPGYSNLLRTAWESSVRSGGPMFTLYQRLRAAKLCCKSINQTSFSNIQKRCREAFEKLEFVQRRVMLRPSVVLFEEEHLARDQWLPLAQAEENLFKSKSRIRWLKEGDANTNFLFKSLIANLGRNVIHWLRDDFDNKVSHPVNIKSMLLQYLPCLVIRLRDQTVLQWILHHFLGFSWKKPHRCRQGFLRIECSATPKKCNSHSTNS